MCYLFDEGTFCRISTFTLNSSTPHSGNVSYPDTIFTATEITTINANDPLATLGTSPLVDAGFAPSIPTNLLVKDYHGTSRPQPGPNAIGTDQEIHPKWDIGAREYAP